MTLWPLLWVSEKKWQIPPESVTLYTQTPAQPSGRAFTVHPSWTGWAKTGHLAINKHDKPQVYIFFQILDPLLPGYFIHAPHPGLTPA